MSNYGIGFTKKRLQIEFFGKKESFLLKVKKAFVGLIMLKRLVDGGANNVGRVGHVGVIVGSVNLLVIRFFKGDEHTDRAQQAQNRTEANLEFYKTIFSSDARAI